MIKLVGWPLLSYGLPTTSFLKPDYLYQVCSSNCLKCFDNLIKLHLPHDHLHYLNPQRLQKKPFTIGFTAITFFKFNFCHAFIFLESVFWHKFYTCLLTFYLQTFVSIPQKSFCSWKKSEHLLVKRKTKKISKMYWRIMKDSKVQ